jgi:hypothetical protein
MDESTQQAPVKFDPAINKAARLKLSDIAAATKMAPTEVSTWASRIALAKSDAEREDITKQLDAMLK